MCLSSCPTLLLPAGTSYVASSLSEGEDSDASAATFAKLEVSRTKERRTSFLHGRSFSLVRIFFARADSTLRLTSSFFVSQATTGTSSPSENSESTFSFELDQRRR